MPCMRWPKESEHLLSSPCSRSEATAMTTEVHDCPESEERRSCVSVESRYGTCVCPAPTARTTCPSAVSEALMATACCAATPSAPERRMRSDPARSTNSSCRRATPPPATCSVRCRCTRQCEREERALSRWPTAVRVSSIVRARRATSAAERSGCSVSPTVAKPEVSPALAAMLPGVVALGGPCPVLVTFWALARTDSPALRSLAACSLRR
mmetsp:Transcript_74148/g.179127  ORF Transcript_74148/g.179127 Transcript_74148/m.179127 type:complete len:211 (+) Transcript_74148:408-1040(+)